MASTPCNRPRRYGSALLQHVHMRVCLAFPGTVSVTALNLRAGLAYLESVREIPSSSNFRQ